MVFVFAYNAIILSERIVAEYEVEILLSVVAVLWQ